MEWGDRQYGWVGDWSARRAALSPDRIAIVDETAGREYTYADLERRANRTARLLEDRGVESGERAAAISRNRIELFDLFFASGKTGGVLAPLSHRLAPPELAELLTLVDPRLLVVESPFLERVESALSRADVDANVLELETNGSPGGWETYADAVPADGSVVRPGERSLEDPYLLLHTGGSTGTPKETTITHGSIYWNSFNTITSWGLRPDDVTPMVFPLFHTGGWNVLSIPLFHVGGTLVIDREVDPGRVLEHVEAHEATVLVAVPTVLRSMAVHDDWKGRDLSSLRFVKSGGGPCRDVIVRAWRERGVDVSQGYGLTECGPNNFAMPDEFAPEKVRSVGKPVLHADARIVDEAGEPLEPGETGELELRGPHAAPAYWPGSGASADAVEASAETFGAGWVSTGDLARVDDDGFYHIEGRTKDAFVSGGENVYPTEVEDAVAAHPGVAEVVVIGVPDPQWGTVGKAVVEPADGASTTDEGGASEGGERGAVAERDAPLSIETLESFLEGRLARFKVPKHLEVVDEIPTSGPDKLDRTAVEERFGRDRP